MNLRELMSDIVDKELLEDRREYTETDLKLAYALTDEEARDLYSLIQAEFEPDLPYLDAITPEVVKEYLEESIHGDWEGFREEHKLALDLMIADLRRYTKNR